MSDRTELVRKNRQKQKDVVAAHRRATAEIARHCRKVEALHKKNAGKSLDVFREKVRRNVDAARKRMDHLKERHERIIGTQKAMTWKTMAERQAQHVSGRVPLPRRP